MNLQRLTDEKIYEILHALIIQNNKEGAKLHLQELSELLHVCYICKGEGEIRGSVAYPTMPSRYTWVECPNCGGSGKLK